MKPKKVTPVQVKHLKAAPYVVTVCGMSAHSTFHAFNPTTHARVQARGWIYRVGRNGDGVEYALTAAGRAVLAEFGQ